MWGDRAKRGLALRVCALITVLLVCAHVYLERAWRGGPPALPQRPPSPPSPVLQERRAHTREGLPLDKHRDREMKRRVSYVRTLKKDPEAGRKAASSEDPLVRCCPHLGLHKKTTRWRVDLEPWAAESHSLEEEARRFLNYITTPQVTCAPPTSGGAVLDTSQEGPWTVCLDSKYSLANNIHNKACRVYSLGLGVADRVLEHSLGRAGCEVHCFDPSFSLPHLQQGDMWLHRMSVDWRDPNPAISAQRHHGNTKKLATILNDFGHRQVDVLKADMESAEWKILENLILDGVVDSVGQLLLELHLHWAGFEVGGDDPTVVRYWFSLLKELERAHFRLFHSYSDPNKPRLFLHQNVLNASSAYTLGWVNTQWRH